MQAQTFLSRVEAAIDEVVRDQPAVLQPEPDARRVRQLLPGGGSDRLRQRRRAGGHQNGVCGYYDGEELAVKNSNYFNDQFDILTSDLFIRRQGGSYRSTCRPAWF